MNGGTSPRGRLILEPSHPRRPVDAVDAAGAGPGTVRVEAGVPFEGPKLLDTHLTDRPVHEEAVDEAPVTGNAEGPNAVAAHRRARGGLRLGLRGAVGGHGVPGPQGAVQHDRGVIAALLIDARPPRLDTRRLTQSLAAVVGRGVGVEAVAARAVGMLGAVPGQKRAAAPGGGGSARGHWTELLEVEVIEVIGELLGPAAIPGIPVAELALVVLSEGVEQETPLVQVRLTDSGLRLRADPLQRWQQDRHENGNDGDDHQKLDECESSVITRERVFVHTSIAYHPRPEDTSHFNSVRRR